MSVSPSPALCRLCTSLRWTLSLRQRPQPLLLTPSVYLSGVHDPGWTPGHIIDFATFVTSRRSYRFPRWHRLSSTSQPSQVFVSPFFGFVVESHSLFFADYAHGDGRCIRTDPCYVHAGSRHTLKCCCACACCAFVLVSVLNRLTSIMEALPPFFGYQIFATLVLMSSACNSGDVMTLLLQYWLVLSGDPFLLCFCSFFVGLLSYYHLVMAGVQQMACKLQTNCFSPNE